MQHHFNEEDKQKFIDFLNSIAINAKFEMDTKDLCQYFKLLAHMQQVMLPKLDANILEVKKVTQLKDSPAPEKKSAPKKAPKKSSGKK